MRTRVTHVKICGFQEIDSARVAIEAGVDAIGLIFVPGVRRRISRQRALPIVDAVRAEFGNKAEIVGLFADQTPEEINRLIGALKLDSVQLCGTESMETCSMVKAPVAKVIALDPAIPTAAQLPRIMTLQQRHVLAGHKIVLDTKIAGQFGGTGIPMDWGIAGELAQAFDLTLAGGLSPDNVADALRTARPWGVDCSSGVESGGKKDPVKIRGFVKVVRDFDARTKTGIISPLFGKT